MKINPLTAIDFYKAGHFAQYPKGTEYVYSNWTCRSDKWANVLPDYDHKVVFFGLQGVVKWLLIDLWNEEFFNKPKDEVITAYKKRMDASLGMGAVGTKHIEDLHDLGYLPLVIKALPEGSLVDIRVPMFTICNTIPDFYWLTNYVETQLSAELWKTMTSATTAREYKRLFTRYAEKTGTSLDFVPFQGHDFSFRGMSGITDASQSGAGHLLFFKGTDTVPAIDYLENYYDADIFNTGFSVPATEHSVMTAGGEDDELDTYRRLITEVYPEGIVSIVSDTWDLFQVITDYTVKLKETILSRDGKVVFRPDTGDPVKIICGDPDALRGSPEYKGVVECLWDIFGGTKTEKGYKLLDDHVGTIYGDSISLERAQKILEGLEKKGFASGNIVFGIGSMTYQYVTRDTFGTAIKATYVQINGEEKAIYKKPKTGDGMKNSAKGLLRVEFEDGKYVLYDNQTLEEETKGLLKAVFLNGELRNEQSLAMIRANIELEERDSRV